MDAKHAGILGAELEKLKQDSQLSAKMSSVLDAGGEDSRRSQGPTPRKKPSESQGINSDAEPRSIFALTASRRSRNRRRRPLTADFADRNQCVPWRRGAAGDTRGRWTVRLRERSRCSSIVSTSKSPGKIYKAACRRAKPQGSFSALRFTEQPKANEEPHQTHRSGRKVQMSVVALSRRLHRPGTSEQSSRDSWRGSDVPCVLERDLSRTEMLTLLEQGGCRACGSRQSDALSIRGHPVDGKHFDPEDACRGGHEIARPGPEWARRPTSRAKCSRTSPKRAQEPPCTRKSKLTEDGARPPRPQQGRQTLVEAIQRLDERGDLVLIEFLMHDSPLGIPLTMHRKTVKLGERHPAAAS